MVAVNIFKIEYIGFNLKPQLRPFSYQKKKNIVFGSFSVIYKKIFKSYTFSKFFRFSLCPYCKD